MIPAPTLTGTDGFVPHCGGTVMNTAAALSRLGVPIDLFTGLYGRSTAVLEPMANKRNQNWCSTN
ncbi:hypothetical protein [Epibacterium ulvae]|uniref:hypothetical protein n=1 Tax=Epibacterium ulvae TaxID=1156985 RepID=UPI003CD0DBE6